MAEEVTAVPGGATGMSQVGARDLEAPVEAASCGTCEYGREAPASAGIGSGQLSCCRGSPALWWGAWPRPPSPATWLWPIVRADWWCGEYSARPLVNPLGVSRAQYEYLDGQPVAKVSGPLRSEPMTEENERGPELSSGKSAANFRSMTP